VEHAPTPHAGTPQPRAAQPPTWHPLTRRRRPTRTETYRASGMVTGAAVADALGAPFEFGPAGAFRARFPEPVLGGSGEMVGGGGFGWAPGEFTDDTQMAVALAESILAAGGYDADTVWTWFRAWAATARDVGTTTRAALGHADWRDVGRDRGRSAANGVLMRSFPLAAAFLDAPDEVLRPLVVGHGALTHPDPAAGWGAWIAVDLCRRFIRGEDGLAALEGLVAGLPDEVRRGFAALVDPDWTPAVAHVGNGSVWGCLTEAVWALRTTTTFADAVVAAVDLGGDADTVGCVTGALAGARYGVQTIPSRWRPYVNGRIDSPTGPRRYDAHALHVLACDLLGTGVADERPPEDPVGPLEVAPGLHAANLLGAAGVPAEWAVVSLCRTGNRFVEHPLRRQVFMIDRPGDHNHALVDALDDAVRAVDAFLADGRTVVVHCHGGRSRTGLVLKAWKMRTDGVDERTAHAWLAERWRLYETSNPTFLEVLRTSWA
jgi:ADP-ribosyl-[dinitrogen reductase] hydrolase